MSYKDNFQLVISISVHFKLQLFSEECELALFSITLKKIIINY